MSTNTLLQLTTDKEVEIDKIIKVKGNILCDPYMSDLCVGSNVRNNHNVGGEKNLMFGIRFPNWKPEKNYMQYVEPIHNNSCYINMHKEIFLVYF